MQVHMHNASEWTRACNAAEDEETMVQDGLSEGGIPRVEWKQGSKRGSRLYYAQQMPQQEALGKT